MRAKEAAEAEVKAYGKAAEKWQKSEEQIRAAERLTSGLLVRNLCSGRSSFLTLFQGYRKSRD